MANKPPGQKKARVKADRRWLAVGVAALLVIIAGVGAWVLMSGKKPLPKSGGSAAAVGGGGSQQQGESSGSKASPAYVNQVNQYNAKAAAQASSSGASYVPVMTPKAATAPLIVTSTPAAHTSPQPPVVSVNPAPSPASSGAGQASAAPRRPVKPDPQMVGEMKNLLKRLSPQAGSSKVYKVASASTARRRPMAGGRQSPAAAATGAGAASKSMPASVAKALRIGSVLYAVEQVALNTDTPGPAQAQVVSGPLKGAKLIGGFKRHHDWLVVQFTKISLADGSTYQIKGYAVNPHTSSVAVRSWANNHTFSRWAALFASGLLGGAGQYAQMAGSTQINAGTGTTARVNPSFNVGRAALAGLGQVGRNASSTARQYFNRPPTVGLKKNQPIGVLIVTSSSGNG